MRDPRIDKLAEVLVKYSTNVRKDQLVLIRGPAVAGPLVLAVYRQVLLAGAHPRVMVELEEMDELFLKLAGEHQLDFFDPVTLYQTEKIDAMIAILGDENTRGLTHCDPKRMARVSAARRPNFDLFMRRAAEGSLKWTATQFPCQASAQDAEMSLSEYEDFVFGAGLLNEPDPTAAWQRVSQTQQRLADFLNGKSDYHVVAANGTDVRMSVAGKKWINCDGHENFPDGEVFTGPVIQSVNGTIHFSFPAVYGGREVQDVRLKFRDGKVVDASAGKGEGFLISTLDTDGGSRFLGECAIGCNYGIKQYTKNTLFDEKIGGTVHFALGAGYPETGNDNKSGVHWDMVVDMRQGGFVEIDGVKFSENGKFLREGFPIGNV
jgi:aminopeptidase